MIVLSKERLDELGVLLFGKFSLFAAERRQLEIQWLKNLRQYKGVYDPEVVIPEGRSKVYPKDTHTKIVGWVAKLMEMMFPAQEKNWALEVTPYPNVSKEDLQQILASLPPDPPPTSAIIEAAVFAFAQERAANMEKECEDQLADSGLDYPELCKKVVRRGGIYGFGVAEGPLVRTVVEREWQPGSDGLPVAVEVKVPQPYFESVQAWDVYPDLSAKRWQDQEGLFTRKILPRHGLAALAKRKDFFGSVIDEYLRDHTKGNAKPRTFEAELNEIKHTSNNTPDLSRQFEIIRYYGYVPAQTLRDIGATVPESAIGKDILADVWLLDNLPIKADTAPFGEKVSDMFHVYIPEEDEDGPLTGTAKVEILRDSQMKLCAIDRMTMDNGAACCRSIVEVNDDLLVSSQTGDISGGSTIHRQGEGNEANYPAVRAIDIPSHLSELIELRKTVLEVFDVESNLPSWRMGNTQPLGEAFRTSNNMSMMASGGDMVTKDDVRSFDRFVKSLVGALVRWNMEFNPKKDIKADVNVLPKGNLSLVAKEVRGAALVQMKQTLTPRQQTLIRDDQFLIEEFRSRDLPTTLLLQGEEAKQALATYDAQQAQAAQVAQGLDTSKTQKQTAEAQKASAAAQEIAATIPAKVEEKQAAAEKHRAAAQGVQEGNRLQSAKLLLEATKPEPRGMRAVKGSKK